MTHTQSIKKRRRRRRNEKWIRSVDTGGWMHTQIGGPTVRPELSVRMFG